MRGARLRGGRFAARFAARFVALLALPAAAGLGCSAISDPSAVAALDFTGVPFPAVVTGDSIRDSTGAAAPLRATAYDGNGAEIVGAPIEFFSLDTGLVIHPSGHLVATKRDGTLRLVATISGLQSQVRTIRVTREPDTLTAPTTSPIAYQYALPDAASNVSAAVGFTLSSSDTAGGVSPNVAGWVVRWRIIHAGDTLAATDTSKFALWDVGASRHSRRDTTGADGRSQRRVRVYANGLVPQPDSVILVAEVRSRGVLVPGSPIRFVVNISPPGP
jgi:hypothetical protein